MRQLSVRISAEVGRLKSNAFDKPDKQMTITALVAVDDTTNFMVAIGFLHVNESQRASSTIERVTACVSHAYA